MGMFGFALHADVIALVDGCRAAEGIAGTPGDAVVNAVEQQRDGQVCLGDFTPEDGGAAVEARIKVPGDERPRAWAAGARDWGLFVPFVIIFAIVCATGAVLIVRCLGGCRSVLRAGSRDLMLWSGVPEGRHATPAREPARE